MKLTNKLPALESLLAGAVLLSITTSALAQHYPVGAEGIRAATLPPPGIYLRDYNLFYYADNTPTPGRGHIFSYLNEPRLIWMTGVKILGADYGMDLIIPFGYSEAKDVSSVMLPGGRTVGVTSLVNTFSLGDIQIEPVLLSWHLQRFDFTARYAFWAPTGDYDETRAVNIGKGFWSQMFAVGGTWYPDEARAWAISLLNRYEINMENRVLVNKVLAGGRTIMAPADLTPGQRFTVEWGISKTVCPDVDIGVAGYWQEQVTEDSGQWASHSLGRVVAVGPEISVMIPKIRVLVSLRDLREFAAKDRPQGDTITLTLMKKF